MTPLVSSILVASEMPLNFIAPNFGITIPNKPNRIVVGDIGNL